MMRCIGDRVYGNEGDTDYTFPQCGDGTFGSVGMQIYQILDLKSRALAKETMEMLGRSGQSVDDILDPVHEAHSNLEDNISKRGGCTFSQYVPDGYISSSIMDNFHYFAPSHAKHERFYNNHSSHTDSGLMTAVIVTDEPGLEVFDQRRNEWIAIEEEVMRFLETSGAVQQDPLCHRKYATFFWSDSVEYLNKAPVERVLDENRNTVLKPLFHRVADCKGERYSVVFKQRTAPLRTHCRYQEDYILASIQLRADTQSKNAYTLWKESKSSLSSSAFSWHHVTVALASLFVVCILAL